MSERDRAAERRAGAPPSPVAGAPVAGSPAASSAAPVAGLTLAEYERAAARTINPRLDPASRLVDAAAGLAEEGGEVLGLVRKHVFMRHELDRARLAKELGDALWCLVATANASGFTLDEIAAANIEKLRRRYPDGYSDQASAGRQDTNPATGAKQRESND